MGACDPERPDLDREGGDFSFGTFPVDPQRPPICMSLLKNFSRI
jgi:hypothetical protein